MAKQKSSGWLDKYQEGGWTASAKAAAYNKAAKQTPTNIDANAMQALEQVTSYPQRKVTEWITGTNQYPSQAMGIQNPYGAFAIDAIADPVNLVGAGLLGKAAKASTKTGVLSKAYKVNPWAFKPNPEAFYHRSPNLENVINAETGMLQGFGQSEAGKAFSELARPGTGPAVIKKAGTANEYVSTINLKKPANNQLYFSKGVPLDYGRYNSPSLGMTGQGYKGPYLIEAEGIPMGRSTKGRRPSVNPPTNMEGYAVSHRPISADEVKFYKEHWLQGYKPIKKDGGWLDKYNDGGPVQPNYNDYSVSASDDFVGEGYTNRGRNYSPAWGGQFEDGGEIAQTGKQVPFDQWYKTVPKSKNDTINYNLRRAYELAPQKDLDAFVKNPNAHLMSAYENPETGIYEFMKSKHHSTINKELDWYNSKEGKDFRNNYNLDTTGDYYRYVPKEMANGGDLSFVSNPKLRNMLEGYKPGFTQSAGDYKHPEGYMAGSIYPSTEVSTSIGGEGGEPSYLIPSFKYGQPLQDPVQEFNMTGQHLGGPFKTWQDAEKFQEIRHQYVEKGQPLPSPIATSNMAMGGSLPGAVGHMYSRQGSGTAQPGDADYNAPRTGDIPSKFRGKKTVASAQNGIEMKYYQEGLDFKPKSISKNGGWLSKYEEGGVIQDDMGQWNHPGEITEIGSNQITMQGVPYPVLGISDTGDTQMMYPDQEYQYNGSSVTEYPMMAEGGEVDPKKKPTINLGDLTMTPAELEYVNASNSGYCPGGNCLENTRKGYDMLAGRIPGIPSSGDIWTKDLQLISTKGTPGEKLVKENPYFRGDTSFGSADSWDIHGAIVKAGGKNIYSQAKGQAIPTDVAIGSMIGWGPTGTRESGHSNRNQGMNKDYGLQPSHHSTQVVNYGEKGEPIVYDSYLGKYGTLSDIAKDLKSSLGYELENISVPKSVAGNTRENLAKKGLLKNELTPYTADVNKLIAGTKQGWAQIKEDGKVRSPQVDSDALSEFASALSKNKGELVSSLRLSNADYDRLANTALALAMTESEGGGALGFSDRFGNTQGMTQLNVDNIKNDARLKSALGKNYKSKVSVTNLLSPASSAIATMMYLSVAEKDAKRLYDKGLKPGVKTFNQPGFIENFRASNSRLNKDGVFIDELNKRIPYSEIPGYEDEDVTQVNNYLKKLTKSDKYNFVNKDGDLTLKMKTKGNNPKLTDIEKIGYMWQSPNALKTGDAEGKSEYVNKVKNYFNLLNTKKMEQGGQLTKLDQLTNFTNYNTKQPGGWLDKYQ
jgi:hypothetical protein